MGKNFKNITMLERKAIEKKGSALIFIQTILSKLSKVFKKHNLNILISSKINKL